MMETSPTAIRKLQGGHVVGERQGIVAPKMGPEKSNGLGAHSLLHSIFIGIATKTVNQNKVR